MIIFSTTDLPILISTDTAAILDPHKKFIKEDKSGWSNDLEVFLKYRDHAACFRNIGPCSVDPGMQHYAATLFRFPLRLPDAISEISSNAYPVERVRDFLFQSFIKEAPIILLFLKFVQEVSLYDGDTLLYKVSVDPNHENKVKTEREELFKLGLSKPSSPSLRLYSMTIVVENFLEQKQNEYHWLIFNMIGSTVEKIRELSQKLEIIPWVGVAAPLPAMISLEGIHVPSFDINNLPKVLQMIQRRLGKSKLSLEWCNEVQGHTEGHAFCFLPLPNTTHLPVNIHGYFAVSDNRRTIEWPASDNKSDKALWNQELILKQVAPLYSVMISFRSQLVVYKNTPLPICGDSAAMTDPYAAWPLSTEVRHKEIWNELVEPTVKGCLSTPVFWSAIGEWVTLRDAIFLPESSNFPFPLKAMEALVQSKTPIVNLPNQIWSTLRECFPGKSIIGNTVTQTHIRTALKSINMIYENYDELEKMLECIFSDISQTNVKEFIGLKIIPLLTERFTLKSLESPRSDNLYFVETKLSEVVELLPGTEAKIVSLNTANSKIIYSSFRKLAMWKLSQIRYLTSEIVCRELLPQSILSWSGRRHNQVINWNNHSRGYPSIDWLKGIWTWLYNNPMLLEQILGLPILPKELIDDTTTACTLLPFPDAIDKFYFKVATEDKLTDLFTKLGATIVEKNAIVSSNRIISHYIVDASIPTLIEYLKSRPSAFQSLTKLDKEELRILIANYYYRRSLPHEFRQFLLQIPIYELGVGNTRSTLSSLTTTGLILPPSNMSFNGQLTYPSNILNNRDSLVHHFILSSLQFSASHIDDVYCAILEYAFVQSQSSSWNNGDDLIIWVMKKCNHLPTKLVDILRNKPFVRLQANSRHFKTPQELFSPEDKQFHKLFDLQKDEVFPAKGYNDSDILRVLVSQLGLKTWSSIKNDKTALGDLICERATNIMNQPSAVAFERSSYILELIFSQSKYSTHLLHRVREIEFLKIQVSPPSEFPSVVPWHGKKVRKSLEAPMKLCSSINSANLIGSVCSIISTKYKEKTNIRFSEEAAANNFSTPCVENVVKQLDILTKVMQKPLQEVESISVMVNAIYKFLNTHSSELSQISFPINWIWWHNEFLPTNKFTLNTPLDMSPFIFCIRYNPNYLKYSKLFPAMGVKDSPQTTDILGVLHSLAQSIPTPLEEKYIKMSIAIIGRLHEERYVSRGDVLLPTTENSLRPVSECTYDDREWIMKKVENRLKKYSFVHTGVSPEIAKYFKVTPLSTKIAPSSKLKIKYTSKGQKESLTHRISGIVNDYSGNIDVFKELIQNADDAEASEIKLLLDWRHHGTESLFEESMSDWQGPAVIAYNNSTFSDQDFENICLLAGETKMSDPLKTGRFGVGFCSCYSLTDVPSFLSRRYLTIFDPHAKYLGERVGLNEPGMQIDIVEENDGVEIYKDQFAPYNGIFGCDLHNLDENGFNGTLFRLPLRMKQSPYSEITNDKYDRHRMLERVNKLQEEAQKLLIFLKHLQSLEVFELKEGARSTSEMKCLFKVTKTPSSSVKTRLNFIKDFAVGPCKNPEPICTLCTISVDISSVKVPIPKQQYLISSALSSTCTASIQTKGLLPLAEIAIKMSENYNPIIAKDGQLFCFLPLPLKHSLSFLINGYFNIGKDRRGLRVAEDSYEYKWNKMLIEEILPMAFVGLLERITTLNKSAPLQDAFLKNYYTLWPDHAVNDEWIAKSFSDSVEKQLLKSNRCLLWTELGDGKWNKISRSCILKKSLQIPPDIYSDAVDTMTNNGVAIVECPKHVFKLIVNIVDESKNLFDYQRFFTEIFIAKIGNLSKITRDKHLVFILGKIKQDLLNPYQSYRWAVNLIKTSRCIAVTESEQLVYPKDLIDVHCTPISDLYQPHDSRFPIELLRSKSCSTALIEMGMISNELPEEELAKRASIVSQLNENDSHQLMERILEYIKYIEHKEGGSRFRPSYSFYESSRSHRQQRVDALFEIKFLKAQLRHTDLTIPWYKTTETFYSPSELHPLKHSELIFSQCPVFLSPKIEGDESVNNRLELYLGIEEKEVDLEDVIENILVLIEHIEQQETLDDATIEFVSNAFSCMYKYLNSQCIHNTENYQCTSNMELIKERLSEEQCIWQDQRLHCPSQMLFHWNKTPYYPYICQLSTKNESSGEVFECLGVQRESSYQYLADVLLKIESDNRDEPLSDDLLKFVVDVANVLYYKKLWHDENEKKVQIYLPDDSKTLRPTSLLCCDSNLKSEWIEGLGAYTEFKEKGGHFINSLISREIALKLGAYPIIDAVLRDIEDEDFYSFGQHEDLVDRLNSILLKYPATDSIFREFIQNADDAKASEIVFVLDNRVTHPDTLLVSETPKWKDLHKTPALCIFNDRPFSEEDIQNICKLGRGGKGETADTIGRFGIGFNVAYHLTDCPMFVSFDENCSPKDFCVFDPLRMYCPKANWKRPGRRWKGSTLDQFSDQFKPFLKDEFERMKSIAPCFNNLHCGFTVFRLPLTHYDPVRNNSYLSDPESTEPRWFKEARVHSSIDVGPLIGLLQSYSENMVLFLKNLMSISVFEIERDGDVVHKFSSTKAVSPTNAINIKEVSLTHQVNMGSYNSRNDCSRWLKSTCAPTVSKCDINLSTIVTTATTRGLELSGASAILIDYDKNPTGLLFFFLPIIIQSCLPVHFNAHFLIDDSRRNLINSIQGLEDWNPIVSEHVLVPSYVELVLNAREKVDGNEKSREWYYGLFPNLDKAIHQLSKASSLNINRLFYMKLIADNVPVLLDLRGIENGEINWLSINKGSSVGLFSSSFYKAPHFITSDMGVGKILASLNMPITCAPDFIFESLCKVSPDYSSVGLLTPDKVLDHFKTTEFSENDEEIIKAHCKRLLEFCLQVYTTIIGRVNLQSILSGAPLLLTLEDTLDCSGYLYESTYSSLLPHCKEMFVKPDLEKSDIGKTLKEGKAIVNLPVSVIASNIQLPDTTEPMELDTEQIELVSILWIYLSTEIYIPNDVLTEYFLHKPIIPSSNGTFYPPLLSKCLFVKTDAHPDILSVINKLGYHTVAFTKVGLYSIPSVVQSILSNTTIANDFIKCMKHCPPLEDVEFTPSEATHLISVITKCDELPTDISCILKRLPLYQTVDGSYHRLSEAKRFYVMPDGVPVEGLLTIQQLTKQLILNVSHFTKNFYAKLISETDYELAKLSKTKFYIELILPNLECLNQKDLHVHLNIVKNWLISRSYFSGILEEEKIEMIEILKNKPIVSKEGKTCKASDLYDPEVKFHATFNRTKLPPEEDWSGDWLLLLRLLGLQRNVDNNTYLTKARKVADEGARVVAQVPSPDLIERSEALLATLRGKIAHYNQKKLTASEPIDFEFQDFLKSVSKIRFVYSSDQSKIERHLQIVTNQSLSYYKPFILFHEAVFHEHENLAVLSPRTVLPSSCDFLARCDSKFRALLSIRQLTTKTVIKNLISLSKLLSCDEVQALVLSDRKIRAIIEIKKIFDEHYEYLNGKLQEERSLCNDLKTERCVLLIQNLYSFNLVKPSQLVINLPNELELRPFCYKVPSELFKYVEFLKSIGVQEEVDPILCLSIMSNIKEEMDKSQKQLSQDEHYLNVCKSAYTMVIVMLRKQTHVTIPKDMKVYLPSEDYALKESKELVCNDVPWIQTRLQQTHNWRYKFVYPPPPDKKGQRIPPPCLGVELLSAIATEELHSDVLHGLNRCTDEELFEKGRRKDNCKMIEVMTETVKSKEFMVGFVRLYWHEHKTNPLSDKSFRSKLRRVKEMSFRCVKSIKTVVKLNGSVVTGTEDDAYLCYLNVSEDGLTLYIAHMPNNIEDFLEQVAANLNKYLDRCIANENPIKTMLRHDPTDIKSALDRLHISPYDPQKEESKPEHMEVGSEISFRELANEDMILFCNFESGEKVIYHSLTDGGHEGSYKIAKIVECPLKPENSLGDRYVQLLTAESDKNGSKVISVPLFQVHKILNTSQRRMIIAGESTQFSNPLIIASFPESQDQLLKWITQTLDYNNSRPCCAVLQLCQRILAHMHYLLVKRNSDQKEMFLIAAKHVVRHVGSLLTRSRSTLKISQTTCEQIIRFVRCLGNLSLDDDDVFGIPACPSPVTSSISLGSSRSSLFSGGASRSSSTSRSRFGGGGGGYSRFSSYVPPQLPTVIPDCGKGKVWLQQAKADFMAVCEIYKKLVDEESNECKYPALVCFLCHDIVEKFLKGVIYIKRGLPEDLVECRDLIVLTDELKKSSCERSLEEVISSRASLVIVHGKVSRYPNYYHPACTPAACYRFVQAAEAIEYVNKLMESVQSQPLKDPDVAEQFGDVETIESDYFTELSRCFQDDTGNYSRVISLLRTIINFFVFIEYPATWISDDDGEYGDFALVLLDSQDSDKEEYLAVASLFESTLRPQHYEIQRIERVQNKLLWRRYFDCARRIDNFNRGVLNETRLFHGSSNSKPEDIYRGDDGFDMRFCNRGMWGKGNYFAMNASYSNSYAHSCPGNRRQMLLAFVLVGHEYNCHSDSSLTKPPVRNATGEIRRRYDCVSGTTAGSKVYITYENDKAYPAYLITYRERRQ